MSPSVALWVLAWIAIVVVYLGLSAVLREVKLLRAQVARLTDAASQLPVSAAPSGEPTLRLPAHVVDGAARVVLTSDSHCPLCRVVLARLGELASSLPAQPVLVTHEPEQAWQDVPPGIRLVRDDDAWRAVAHLSPPVLMFVTPDGAVSDLVLPARQQDVDAAVAQFASQGVAR